MIRLVILDSAPLGLLAMSPSQPVARECDRWLRTLLATGIDVAVPEIVDYEVRRELIRLGFAHSVRRLDTLLQIPGVFYLPITTAAMRLAAQLWSDARRMGRPTADRHALDGDAILAAQARLAAPADNDFIVATTNARHLSLFVPAADWATVTA